MSKGFLVDSHTERAEEGGVRYRPETTKQRSPLPPMLANS